jgi:hypothetical protein
VTDRSAAAAGIRANSDQWRKDGSPFYALLASRIADDVEAGGPCWPVVEAHASRPAEQVPGVRLLAAVHRDVLRGRARALAPHYPSVGGDGDADAAWPLLRDHVAANADDLTAWVDHVPQTNEVGRSIAIVGGWLTVAAETGLPLRLLEPGCSAALNLRADHYRYEQGGRGWGEPDSPVRFVDRWDGGVPPLDVRCEVADRRGCDRFPVDATSEDGQLTLLAYVFADELERFRALRAALEVAGRVPVEVDRGEAAAWLEEQLAVLPEGQATVVFHSYFWQYLSEDDAGRARRALLQAGERATRSAPLSWLSLEEGPGGDYAGSELRLRTWPGGDERLLATCHAHPGQVRWLG